MTVPNDSNPAPAFPSPVSKRAAEEFRASLPSLLAQASACLETSGFTAVGKPGPAERGFMLDLQGYFGETLAAVWEMDLAAALPEEMEWLSDALAGRGLGPRSLQVLCRAWIAAMHGALGIAALKETVPWLEWISASADRFRLSSASAAPASPDPETEAFLKSLIANRTEEAVEAAVRHSRKHGVESCLEKLFLSGLREIGRAWAGNRFTVADEHLATVNLIRAAFRFFSSLKPETGRGRSVAVSSAPGDAHSVSGELLSLYLEHRGWTVLFFGNSMPESDLVRAIVEADPSAAVITASMLARLPALRRVAAALRKQKPGLRVLATAPRKAARPAVQAFCDGVFGSFEECHALLSGKGGGHAA